MKPTKKIKLKNGLRLLGIDDGYFPKNTIGKVPLIGVITQGNKILEGILISQITKDGLDITKNLIKMIIQSKFYKELNVIITSGNTYGGFNPLNIIELNEETSLPVINVTRNLPREKKILMGLKNFPDGDMRYEILKKSGIYYRYRDIFYQKRGVSLREAEFILNLSIKNSKIPECVRIAHLIGKAMETGESGGKA